MGKMSKKSLDELKRDDPSENNWEIVEEKKELTPLEIALAKVDPEINRADNPVWQYVVKDKEVVIVFQSGQKVRVPR